MASRGLLLLTLFVGAVGNASASSLSCRERGFADALQCSGCKKMHDLVKDDGAYTDTVLAYRTAHLTAYLLSFLHYTSNPRPSARPAFHVQSYSRSVSTAAQTTPKRRRSR